MGNRYTYAVQIRGENGEVVATHGMQPTSKDSFEYSNSEEFCALCSGNNKKMYVVYTETEGVRRETSMKVCETCTQMAIEEEANA